MNTATFSTMQPMHSSVPALRNMNRPRLMTAPRRLGLATSKRQTKFLLVVKLIVKSLESGSLGDRMLAAQVKSMVRNFTRQNRAGYQSCIPLQDKLESSLRAIVGDAAFIEASFQVDFYFAKKRVRAAIC